jgi:hypothetical protein
MERATALYLPGALAEWAKAIGSARGQAPARRSRLSADEVAALAEGWELQARVEFDKGRLLGVGKVIL